jgi:hypothetical protein
LNLQFISDVFQYPSEQEIIEYGYKQRGINNLLLEISNRLDDLAKLIKVKREDKSNKSDAIRNAFLWFIAIYLLNIVLEKYLVLN